MFDIWYEDLFAFIVVITILVLMAMVWFEHERLQRPIIDDLIEEKTRTWRWHLAYLALYLER